MLDRANFIDIVADREGLTDKDLMKWVPAYEGDGRDDDDKPANRPYSNPAEAKRAIADEQADLLHVAVNVGMSGFKDDTRLGLKAEWLTRAGKSQGPGAWNTLTKQGQDQANELTTFAAKEIKKKETVKAGDGWLPGEVERKDGNFVSTKVVGKGAAANVVETFICKAFEPIEKTIAPGQTNPGLRIKFGDKEIAIGSGQLHGSKDELARYLHTENGLECGTTRESHDALAELLRCAMHHDKLPEVTEAQSPGWFSPVIWACANGKVVGSDSIRLSKGTGYTERAPEGVGDGAREQAIYDSIWTKATPKIYRLA
jgi:hypothetical protein